MLQSDENKDTLAGPFDDIQVDKVAQELDYEGELCIVIGKDIKNISETDNVLDYILGFTAGNDVSSRYWQWPEMSGSQNCYAKSFDNFAPIGPIIVSPKAIGDPGKLLLKTWVNKELRQSTSTEELIFGVDSIVRFLSQGMTLRKGTVIMTGTPE